MIQTKASKAIVAKRAIAAMGGPLMAADKIQDMSGRACNRNRIQKWMVNGIPAPWHPYVHQLTDIPLNELDAEIYPAYIFSS